MKAAHCEAAAKADSTYQCIALKAALPNGKMVHQTGRGVVDACTGNVQMDWAHGWPALCQQMRLHATDGLHFDFNRERLTLDVTFASPPSNWTRRKELTLAQIMVARPTALQPPEFVVDSQTTAKATSCKAQHHAGAVADGAKGTGDQGTCNARPCNEADGSEAPGGVSESSLSFVKIINQEDIEGNGAMLSHEDKQCSFQASVLVVKPDGAQEQLTCDTQTAVDTAGKATCQEQGVWPLVVRSLLLRAGDVLRFTLLDKHSKWQVQHDTVPRDWTARAARGHAQPQLKQKRAGGLCFVANLVKGARSKRQRVEGPAGAIKLAQAAHVQKVADTMFSCLEGHALPVDARNQEGPCVSAPAQHPGQQDAAFEPQAKRHVANTISLVSDESDTPAEPSSPSQANVPTEVPTPAPAAERPNTVGHGAEADTPLGQQLLCHEPVKALADQVSTSDVIDVDGSDDTLQIIMNVLSRDRKRTAEKLAAALLQVQQLQQALAGRDSVLTAAQGREKQLQQALADKEKLLAESQSRAEQLDANLFLQHAMLKTAQAHKLQLHEESLEKDQRLQQLEREVAEQKSQVAAQAGRLTEQGAQMRSMVAMLEARIKQQYKQLATAAQQEQVLSKELLEAKQELDREAQAAQTARLAQLNLSRQVQQLEQRLAEKNKQLQEQLQEAQQLQYERDVVQTQLRQYSGAIQQVQQRLAAVQECVQLIQPKQEPE